jgi:hypothetical protein
MNLSSTICNLPSPTTALSAARLLGIAAVLTLVGCGGQDDTVIPPPAAPPANVAAVPTVETVNQQLGAQPPADAAPVVPVQDPGAELATGADERRGLFGSESGIESQSNDQGEGALPADQAFAQNNLDASGQGLLGGGLAVGVAGSGAAGGFQNLNGFFQQSCYRCHSNFESKGGVRLDQMDDNVAKHADLYRSVLAQLESGAMPPAEAGQPDPQQKALAIEYLRNAVSTLPEPSFIEQAESEFKRGDFQRAKQLFYAQVLSVDDSQAAEYLKNIRLYRPKVAKPEELKASNDFAVDVKPRLVTELTFAVGIDLDAGPNVTEVKPIGVKQISGAGGFGGGVPGGASMLESFEDLTGEYGAALIAAFGARKGEGKYGELFKQLIPTKASQPAATNAAAGLMDDRGAQFGQGAFQGVADSAMGGGANKTMADQPLSGGLTYIGTGSMSELLKKSNGLAVDGIFIFDVKATRNARNGIVTNDTRMRFLLPSGKVIATASKTLKNTDIERAAAQGKSSDDVKTQVDQVFARLDQLLLLDEVPKMSDKSALKHLHTLVHSEAPVLQTMAEARLFHSKGIISQQQLETIYQIVMEGNEGVTLASGSPEDRKLVLGLYLEKL